MLHILTRLARRRRGRPGPSPGAMVSDGLDSNHHLNPTRKQCRNLVQDLGRACSVDARGDHAQSVDVPRRRGRAGFKSKRCRDRSESFLKRDRSDLNGDRSS